MKIIVFIIHLQQIFWILFMKMIISGSQRESYRDAYIREHMIAILKPFSL